MKGNILIYLGWRGLRDFLSVPSLTVFPTAFLNARVSFVDDRIILRNW
jgi:hypothetical protein